MRERTPPDRSRPGGNGGQPEPGLGEHPNHGTGPERAAEPLDEDAADLTLGGYQRRHGRPPAFEGPDGHAYTVSPEVERTGEFPEPYAGYLVFPRWADGGMGILGHVETPTVARGATHREALDALERLTLPEVQALLDEAVRRHSQEHD